MTKCLTLVGAALLTVGCAYHYPTEPASTTTSAATTVPPPVVVTPPPAAPEPALITVQVSQTSTGTSGAPIWLLYTITRSATAPAVQAARLTFGDGDVLTLNPITASASVEHTYGRSGSFPVILTVTDALGRTAIGTTNAYVPDRPPTPPPPTPPPPPAPMIAVALTSDLPSVAVNGTLTFTADATLLNAGETVTSYQWDLNGDGTFEGTSTVNVRTSTPYATAGLFTARVLVTTSTGRHNQGSVGFVVTN